MRRTLVWIALIGALGFLAIRLWPAPAEDSRRELPTASTAEAHLPTGPFVQISGDPDLLDEKDCAGPALYELVKHPNWELVFSHREWDDVVGNEPDETLATIVITERTATWRDGDLPQSLDLTPAERSDVLAAARRSCARTRDGNGFTGHYISIAYGQLGGMSAMKLPSESRAADDVLAVFDRVRTRYVQGRLAIAREMTLSLTGPRRSDDVWRRYTLTVHPDGRVMDGEGEALEPLAALDLVDVLDWALALPDSARGPYPLKGTIAIAGSKKTVAFSLDDLQKYPSVWRSPFLQLLLRWWRINLDP